ncbi:MAG TPA: hypothetical protein PLW44_06420 [Chitinophagales bacterium]|nr:hypothetical protein [Chitinophagales bacterium]
MAGIKSSNFFPAILFLLVFSCKTETTKNKYSNNITGRVKNLDSKEPVIWGARCNTTYGVPHWTGDYAIVHDSIWNINIETLREEVLVMSRVLRFGKWLLKGQEGEVYAEAFYDNDSLVSFTKYDGYSDACSIDSICGFKYCDTVSFSIIY